MNRNAFLLFAVLGLGLAACSGEPLLAPDAEEGPPSLARAAPSGPLTPARVPIGHFLHANQDAQTRRTFEIATQVERAVWRYVDENDGTPPVGLGDPNLSGKTLVDYLPGKKLLWNPIVRVRTNPIMGAAAWVGSVGYMEILDGMGYVVGFTISAMGATPDDVLHYDRYVADWWPRGPGRDGLDLPPGNRP